MTIEIATLKLKPQFVTVDDFNNYHGKNLRDLLRSYGQNDSYDAERFLAKTELKLMNIIDRKTFRIYDFNNLTDRQLAFFKMAILEHAWYRYKNGDIGNDSGYNPERGDIVDQDEKEAIRVSQDTIDLLSNAGLWNMNIKNRPRKFAGGMWYLGLDGGPSYDPNS